MLKNNLKEFPESEMYYDEGVASGEIVKVMVNWKKLFEQELRKRLAKINVSQKENNEKLKAGVKIEETSAFYNNGQYNLIKEILGEIET
jgi:hypothetical protein